MTKAFASVRRYFVELWAAWNEFWFEPADPAPLCGIRVVTGLLLLWTHFVWSFDLLAFFGASGWIPPEMHERLTEPRMSMGFFDLTQAAWAVWTFHVLSLVAFLLLTIGLFSRTAAVWSFLAALSYALHVTPGAFFGLDKINCFLAMYVMLGPCGARYSVDRLLRIRSGREDADPDYVEPAWSANLTLRLIQTHLCVIYLFGGLGKLLGETWWRGQATWLSVANVEYRSLDMTWMAYCLPFAELLAHATVFFELFYCCLVWSRWTKPWMLLTAVGVHAFIGLAMGMPEFALAMLTMNAAFLTPGLVRGVLDPVSKFARGLLRKKEPGSRQETKSAKDRQGDASYSPSDLAVSAAGCARTHGLKCGLVRESAAPIVGGASVLFDHLNRDPLCLRPSRLSAPPALWAASSASCWRIESSPTPGSGSWPPSGRRGRRSSSPASSTRSRR